MTVEKRAEENRAAKRRDKDKKYLPPTEIRLIGFPEGEFRPLFVSSKDVEKVVIGWNKKSAANARSLKKGPRFYVVHGMPFYRISDLEDHFGKNPVETFNEN